MLPSSTTKKKILFIITKSNFGGAQRYVYDIARSLPSNSFEVVVAFGGEGILKEKLADLDIRVVPIKGLERDVHIINECKVFFQLLTLYTKERPDIVHLNSSKIGGLGGFAGRIARVPHIIFTGHGWAFNEERPWLQKKVIAFFHWLTIVFSHTTIAVSEQIKNQISSFPFISQKIVMVYNGVGVAGVFSKQEARDLLLKHNKKMAESIPADALWIGTVAELHKTKGIQYAIRAIEKLVAKKQNVVFIIIGEGEERHNLRALIEEKGLEKHVFLFGFIDVASQYLRAFDIFTLTSISEALSLSILEAGLSECAVVASRVGGIPEIITSEKSGILVPPRNPEKIAQSLAYLIQHPEKREEYGRQLRNTVQETFSLEKMLQNTIEVYTQKN